MTGLTRKEVRRLRDKTMAGQGAVVIRPTPMATILHKWYSESEFLDRSGAPAILKFDGPGATFSSLVRKYGGDIPPGAMRTELKRIKAIDETETGDLRVLKRNVSGLDVHEKLIAGLARVLYPAAATIAHNTSHGNDTWIQRIVFTESVRDADFTRLRRISSDRLVEFTESIDDLFVAYEALNENETDSSAASGRSVGLGVFYFEEDKVNAEQASVA